MNNTTIAAASVGVVLVVLAFALVQDSIAGALVDWYNSGTLVGVRGGGNFIGQNGVQATSTDSAANDRVDFALSVDLVTTGADADSTTATSPSGLEIVASELTILRGCVDNEVLLWDEATDEWACFTPESRETQFLTVRKGSPGTINVGEAVFISGFNIGQSVPEVELAENDIAASMPAIGLAFESITNSANNRIVISGRLSGAIDTSAFTAGDTIFISNTAGEVTATRPTAAGEQVQSIGLVLRSNASQGELEIVGAGRANDTPNTAFDPAITWGTGSGFTWTFDAGATDPVFAFDSAEVLIGLETGPPSADPGAVHVWRGSAGTVTANVSAALVLEDDTAVGLQFLSPNTEANRILFGDSDSATRGQIIYQHGSDLFEVVISNSGRLQYSVGNFAFQEATNINAAGNLTIAASTNNDVLIGDNATILRIDGGNNAIEPLADIDFQQAAEISTTAGNLTLNPAGNVSSTASIGPTVDSSFDLGVETNGQWANLWADLVNGADFAYQNGWRSLEAEKYAGYPRGIAFANTCFTPGKITETMPRGCKPIFVITEQFVEFNGRRIFFLDGPPTNPLVPLELNVVHEIPAPAPPSPPAGPPAGPPVKPPILGSSPVHTEVGNNGVFATIPLTLTINDPVTGQPIRELRLIVENVDLTTFASSTLSANTFLSTAISNASSTLGGLTISTRGTVIEHVEVDLDDNDLLISVEVTANVEVFTDAYSQRVILKLKGLDFTDFNPASATFSTILTSIKTNIINRFGE